MPRTREQEISLSNLNTCQQFSHAEQQRADATLGVSLRMITFSRMIIGAICLCVEVIYFLEAQEKCSPYILRVLPPDTARQGQRYYCRESYSAAAA